MSAAPDQTEYVAVARVLDRLSPAGRRRLLTALESGGMESQMMMLSVHQTRRPFAFQVIRRADLNRFVANNPASGALPGVSSN